MGPLIRFGIIGGGLMGRELASAIARWFHVADAPAQPRLVAICDPRPEAREWFDRHFDTVTQSTPDHRELLANAQVDAVYVAVPHDLHQGVYVDVIRAGKCLLGEKPFGIDQPANAAILAASAERPEVVVRCSSEFPFFPAALRIARYASEGLFGDILEVDCGFLHGSDLDPLKPINWKRTVRTNGQYGCMGDLGMHVFHLPLRAGWTPSNVRAVLSNVYARRPGPDGQLVPYETWDNATLLCEVPAGGPSGAKSFPLVARMQRIAPGETNTWYLTVKGTRALGAAQHPQPSGTGDHAVPPRRRQAWQVESLGSESAYKTITGGIFEFGFSDAILQMVTAFCHEVVLVGGGSAPFGCATLRETQLTHAIFTAALESHRTGGWWNCEVAMAADILIGIDLGTTVLKAAAIGAARARLAQAARKLAIQAGPDGRREQDPAAILRAVRATAGELRRQLGRAWQRVAGVGLASQGGSTVLADRRTGRPHTDLMLWNDMRFMPYVPRMRQSRPLSYWRRLSWRDEPGWGLARLLWLREVCPRLLNGATSTPGRESSSITISPGSGGRTSATPFRSAATALAATTLDPEPLRPLGLDLSFFAPLRRGHQTHGLSAGGAALLGLPAGVPAAGPYMDHEVGYLAAAGVSERPLQCSLGTAWVGNFILPERARWASPVQLVLPAIVGSGRLVVQPLLTGNVTWDWALRTLLGGDGPSVLRRLPGIFGQALLPPDGMAALPWLNMPNPLWPDAMGGAAFFGMGPHTSREDLLRAVAAGMAYELARVLAEVAGGWVDSVVLGGGAVKGEFFRTLLAGLFAPLPVYAAAEEDWAGPRGAVYAFGPSAAAGKANRVRPPNRGLAARIEAGYRRYLELFDSLYGGVPAGGAVRFAGRTRRRTP